MTKLHKQIDINLMDLAYKCVLRNKNRFLMDDVRLGPLGTSLPCDLLEGQAQY
jgi:hypothetical protein